MKIIEAMKKIKDLTVKAADLREKVGKQDVQCAAKVLRRLGAQGGRSWRPESAFQFTCR